MNAGAYGAPVFLRTMENPFFILCIKKYKGGRPGMCSKGQDCICKSFFKSDADKEIGNRYIKVLIKYILQQEESRRM